MLDRRIDHRLGILAGHPDQHNVARKSLQDRRDLAVVTAKQEVAFLMT